MAGSVAPSRPSRFWPPCIRWAAVHKLPNRGEYCAKCFKPAPLDTRPYGSVTTLATQRRLPVIPIGIYTWGRSAVRGRMAVICFVWFARLPANRADKMAGSVAPSRPSRFWPPVRCLKYPVVFSLVDGTNAGEIDEG
jgi:hypothetical protein